MVQQGNRGLDTANTAYPRPTANLTRATRTSLAPTYDACAQSAHWSEAKMCMRIPSIVPKVSFVWRFNCIC